MLRKVTYSELQIISDKYEEGWLLLTADKLHELKDDVRIALINAQRKEQNEQAKEILVNNIEKQFEKWISC